MAVVTTPRIILDGAYAKSQKNKPGAIATESVELLQLVIRAMRGLYAFSARINPTFFAESAAVAFAAPGWPRPQTAEAIFRIENPAGAEVVVVPFDDRGAEKGMPAVFPLGQVYRPASAGAPDPQAGNLTFFYSKRPTDPADLNATLDALWTEQFNELLILEVAIYLAIKDGRADELGAYKSDRDRWANLFGAFLEHETMNLRRRYGQIGRFNTQSMVPLMSLLAGGPATTGGQ
jgi:hypothetical protein